MNLETNRHPPTKWASPGRGFRHLARRPSGFSVGAKQKAGGKTPGAQGIFPQSDKNVGEIDIRGEMSTNPTHFLIFLQNSSPFAPRPFQMSGPFVPARA